MRKLTLISLTILLLSLALATPTLADGQGGPYIQSCDGYGNTKNVFNIGETVYVKGRLNKPNSIYNVYIVLHYDKWQSGRTWLKDLTIIVEPIKVYTNESGYLYVPGGEKDQYVVPVWSIPMDSSKIGYYDIFADCQTAGIKGKYEEVDEIDAFDVIDTKKAGFHVIPEMPLGPIAMLLACFTSVLLKYRRPLSLRG